MNTFDELGKPTHSFDIPTERKESEPKTWTAPSLTVFDIGEETLGVTPSGPRVVDVFAGKVV